MKPEKDDITGEATTGHEWDGVKELNSPIPKAIKIWLLLSIAIAVTLTILYPSFPSLSGYAKGLVGYSSRLSVTKDVREGQQTRDAAFAVFTKKDVDALARDPEIKSQYFNAISVLYQDNCAACHGRDLSGQTNFPNLIDDHWLWGGTPEDIENSITVGINHTHEDTQFSQMPAFADTLENDQIIAVVNYVRSLSFSDYDAEKAKAGATVFTENCADCHGDAGAGGDLNGAPSLSDRAWIYGASFETLVTTVRHGRMGVMPGWSERLSPSEIKQLAAFVYWSR